MTFTREELEDIWNNKPYGYFTELRKKKDLSKFKKYTIEAKVLMQEMFYEKKSLMNLVKT